MSTALHAAEKMRWRFLTHAHNACKISGGIHRVRGPWHARAQQVQLARLMEQSAREFAAWRKTREREVCQLRKQGRKQQAQVQKLEALQAKQAAVLRRKTEEAEAARRRLKAQPLCSIHSTPAPKHSMILFSGLHTRDCSIDGLKSHCTSVPSPLHASTDNSWLAAPLHAPCSLMGLTLQAEELYSRADEVGCRLPEQEMVEVQRASTERRERSGSVSSAAERRPSAAALGSGVEVQPNGGAPLLRDEKARRDWVEHELDMCCQVRAPARTRIAATVCLGCMQARM